MKKKKRWLIGAVILLMGIIVGAICILWLGKEEMKLVLYDGPASLHDATQEDMVGAENKRDISLLHCVDTMIKVNGQDCYVYDTNVNHGRQWKYDYMPSLSRTPIAYFDFSGKVEIEITVPERDLDEVTISPMSYGIEPKVDKENHTVSFSIREPDTYTVYFDNSPERAVHIFANPIEIELPDFEDENVIYIGPGEHNLNTIHLKDNQTLYIAGGAVVHGTIKAKSAENVTVMGRGIIDGSLYDGWQGRFPFIALQFDVCRNVAIKDILVLNSNAWVCQGYETENMVIDGLKIISCRPNSDGITLQSCRNIEVRNSFVRSWDDSLVVKNYYQNSENIHFSDIQIWTDFAQSMEIGYETNKGKQENSAITNISFRNICVLHNFHKPVISIHNGDDAVVSNIVFSDITVEDANMGNGDGNVMPYLVDINIDYNSGWSSTENRGTVQDVTIENVSVIDGKFCNSRISGYDAQHKVSNVTISGLEILGEKITDPASGKFLIDEATTENIIFN